MDALATVICGNPAEGVDGSISPYRTERQLHELFRADLALSAPEDPAVVPETAVPSAFLTQVRRPTPSGPNAGSPPRCSPSLTDKAQPPQT